MNNWRNRRLTRYLLIGTGIIWTGGWWTVTETKKYLGYEFLSLATADRRWSAAPFIPERWKKGDEKSRASMAVDLIRSGQYIGKPVSEVRNDLGEWDGYFENDGIPAFVTDSTPEDSWEVLFLPNDAGRVREIRIHKSCCYRGPFTIVGHLISKLF